MRVYVKDQTGYWQRRLSQNPASAAYTHVYFDSKFCKTWNLAHLKQGRVETHLGLYEHTPPGGRTDNNFLVLANSLESKAELKLRKGGGGAQYRD